jgi:DNA polymerase III epsilon subunit-like protein
MPNPLVIFLDIESTGLDPDRNQVLEVGLVPVIAGVIRDDLAAECQVRHDSLTYQPERLLKMGHGLDPRPGVPVIAAAEADGWLYGALLRCQRATGLTGSPADFPRVVVGGKNPWFDLRFLGRLCPTAVGRVKHRAVDVGGLCLRPDDPVPPDLAECLRRCGLPDRVEHTALADSRACAAVYAVWCQHHAAVRDVYLGLTELKRIAQESGSDLTIAMAERVAAQNEMLSRRAEVAG